MAGERPKGVGVGQVLGKTMSDADRPALGDGRERFWSVGTKLMTHQFSTYVS